MPLIDSATQETLSFDIELVHSEDYELIVNADEFVFDWSEEELYEVYKLFLLDEHKSILGLMSIIDIPDEYRVHLNLIEVASYCRGKDKRILNVAGCLLAHACTLAFQKGYFGFVSLQPKTKLIQLYQDRYGFSQYGRLLGIEQAAAKALIDKYLEDEEQ
jgi:hypothetical protein